jgi:hypothetical protein
MSDSYNFETILSPWIDSPDSGVVGIDSHSLYGYWERKDGSEGGGLWFERLDTKGTLELVDYDGAFELPRSVVAALRAAGVVLDETFNA